ncbi:phosphonate C-P lyase system protein PhnG [Hoeflea prorocentri]|uniref:Phosphonate C-P lyase system protein PhnG n=1 Tax=Hoeflea prorocentri TaxID=1922333 RepID=A0A9X3UJY6_9HYPH|nr:phosphonate C-P lyase system protein PhnG [Hoeflea prorocentri]MCY6382044.1 phosphonate C-P lyase system protein PhnG [Hoeflea prorocentri]MDA5399844.1 phosphonate C-P lyase system protein PhnG [Hoeflea prorocentri]
MAVLARATREELVDAWNKWPQRPDFDAVRGPETGLVMLRGRIGGGGAPFNFGEATVTRATMRLSTGRIGHAYAFGTDKEKVRHAALFDALWQDETFRQRVESDVIHPVRDRLDAEDKRNQEETAATRVDFFTMVRGED